MNIQQNKLIFFSIVALATIAVFATILSGAILRTEGAESNVEIEVVPVSGNMPEDVISFIIKPQKTDEKISGVDLRLTLDNAKVTSWEGCTHLNGGDNSVFTEGASDLATGRYSCAIFKKDAELPDAVVVKAKVSCNGAGPAKVKIDTSTSQISGPVAGILYGFGTVGEGSFECGSPSEKKEDVSVTFEPGSCTAGVNEKCSYELKVASNDDSKKISGYYVKLSFNPSLIKALPFEGGVKSGSGSGTVKGILAQALSPTPGTPASRTCTSTADCIANYCSGNPSCGLVCAIPTGATTGVCIGAVAFPSTNPTPSSSSVSPSPLPTVVSSGTPFPSAGLSVTPATTTTPIPEPTSGTTEDCQIIHSKIDNEKGTIEYMFGCNKPVSELKSNYFQALNFEGISDGEGTLEIADLQVVGPQSSPVYTSLRGKASYTITKKGGDGEPGKDGKVNLNLKLRLQCVVEKPKEVDKITAKIGIGDGKLKEPIFQKVELTVDDKGFWNGKATFDVAPGRGYKLLTKGEKHIQKKICDAQAKEDFPGAYSCDKGKIELKETTDIDLSKIVQLSGDLAHEDQDGIVNAFDMAKIRLCLGKKDETCIKNADLNYNKVVETNDWACAIAALSVRWDDQ